MCGICGKYNYKTRHSVSENMIKKMRDRMITRGPDDGSLYLDDCLGLGFRRLSIIDIDGGRQPVSNESNEIWMVANGEIYNYKQLREELRAKGHCFKTKTDIEVILHAYEDFGLEAFKLLRGMFGVAIWDKRKKKLILARDGAGIKPLYYGETKHGMVFGSELKALFCDPDLDFAISKAALTQYFAFNYVQEPFSIFESVKKLPSGHLMVCDDKGIQISQFWKAVVKSKQSSARTDLFLDKIEDAVKSQLVSDVPVGAFLSGGLDSSTVCYFYNKHYPGNLHTFSVGFRDNSYNELPYAQLVADVLKTKHHNVFVDENIVDILPSLVRYFDEPFGDSSMVPLYYVSRKAREYVKVVLVGDGADELLGGYETYIANELLKIYKKFPNIFQKTISRIVTGLPVSFSKVSWEHKFKRFVKYANESDGIKSHASWRGIFDSKTLPSLVKEEFLVDDLEKVIFGDYTSLAYKEGLSNSVTDYCYLDFVNYLPSDMLGKVDRMTMMNSIEARPPFLDQEFIKYAFSVPSKFKLRILTTKYLMKKAMRPHLPEMIIRRSKQGFNVPVSKWFLGPLKDLLLAYIHSDRAPHHILKKESVLDLLLSHQSKKADYGYQLWNLLIFYIWFDEVFLALHE